MDGLASVDLDRERAHGFEPRFYLFDTETTGATPDDRVCEIAYIEIDENMNEVSRHASFIDPERPISFGAMGVNNITNEMVASAPTIDEYFTIVNPLPPGEIYFIAHKAAFDRRYLEPVLNHYGITVLDQLCTVRLARRYLPDAENHKLSTLAYQYGLDKGESHSAGGDVTTTISLLRFCASLAGKGLPQLIAEEHVPVLHTHMPFGKHKNVPMSKLDRGYAQWCLRNMADLDPDLKFTLEQCVKGLL